MLSLIIFIILCFASAFIGSIFTFKSLKTWYPTIKKPSWNPPKEVFGPVWTVLYLLMAVSGWMIWERTQHVFGIEMVLFLIQLVFNTLWSLIFFGLRHPGWAFVDVILLWIFIVLTMLSFWSIYWLSGALFIPYLIWVSFAAFLNFTIWQINRKT